jgi:hypothetical protein
MQLTGHKNVASVNGYSSASFNQQQKMSNILTDIGTGSRWLIPQETNTSRSGASSDVFFEGTHWASSEVFFEGTYWTAWITYKKKEND